MYSPQLGRFLSEDPLTRDPVILNDNNWFGERLDAMRNTYWYANNDPVNKRDPSGLMCAPCPRNPPLPTDEATLNAVCDVVRRMHLERRERGSAIGSIICAPCGQFQVACLFGVNLAGVVIPRGECPHIDGCLIEHERRHFAVSLSGHCDPNNPNVHLALAYQAEQDALNRFHRQQLARDVQCLRAVQNNPQVSAECREKARILAFEFQRGRAPL